MKNLSFLALALLWCININAQQQSSLGKGLKFEAPDESFSLKFGLRIQPLFTTNYRDYEQFDTPLLRESQMMIRRARLKFDGYVYNKKWVYKFELAFGNRNIGGISDYTNMGARIILDAVIKYNFHKNYSLWFGQTKLPGNRERVVSSQKLQFVDRHIINSRFNLDRDMGFQFHSKYNLGQMPFNMAFAFSMGEGRNITVNNIGGFEYTLRAELLPLGSFSSKKGHYSEGDLDREPKPKIAIGVTFDYNDNASRVRGNQGDFMLPDDQIVTNSLTTYWADMIFKYNGWSAMIEYALRNSKNTPIVLDQNGNYYNSFYVGQGINFQLAYVLKTFWEFGGRVSILRPEENITNQQNQFTFVVSKYLFGHNLKIQSDISYTDFKTFQGVDKSDPLMFRFQVEVAL